MGLFKSKPEISIEDCCQQFYDSQIFLAVVNDTDLWSIFLDNAFKSVAEADPSFSVDTNLFRTEMTALRMEVFALACSAKLKREQFTLPQSFFTRHYLEENGRLDIWDIMGEYNQTLTRSAYLTATGEEMQGGMGRARIGFIDMSRVEMFDTWAKKNNISPDPSGETEEQSKMLSCVARAANRIGVDMRRANCVAAKRLATRLADRLKCSTDLKAEALFRLAATIFGFYKGAEDYLKSISVSG